MALRILALIFGVLLLLPGVCSLGFMAAFVPEMFARPSNAGDLAPLSLLWAVCFAVSFGGILMIRSALRGLNRPAPGPPPPGGPLA